ncbi:MAG: lysine 2,3-aminomutase [Myxococcales bacterium]|nr:lysine 2,3-aminomutase [Myxococcales bacterium]|tara:strand:- start:1337 stop:2464 length:1128 start_codon:yes stop_codon:yes gene_type:complete
MSLLSVVPSPLHHSSAQASWDDWRWQMRNAIRSEADLASNLLLSEDERKALKNLLASGGLPFRVTPHYMRLMLGSHQMQRLRAQVIPSVQERDDLGYQRVDPLGEEDHEAVPHLIHRYADRALLFVTDRCAAYCRYCTRKRLVGQGPTPKKNDLQKALDYIRDHSEIRDVILSGGDALILDDDVLCDLVAELHQISHVDIIRLATRMLTFAPMRFTPELLKRLQEFQPLYFLVHINHPDEIGPDATRAMADLVNAGFPVLNQTVLLKGVNDDVETLQTLFHRLSTLRVRPYYLHQCDLIEKTAGFRVPIKEAIALYGRLRGHLSGLSIPTFVVDIPGGHGKVSLAPNPIVKEDAQQIYLRGFDGRIAAYPLDLPL